MPLIEESSYRAPWFCSNAHLQTVIPSFFRKEEFLAYERECFSTPDDDFLYLDWARCGRPTEDLLIISHGLCGHTYRHYVLSLAKSFLSLGVDCLAWNFRGTGHCPNRLLKITTSNSTNELDWVTRHAIQAGGYRRVYLAGYSMGANLCLLYLGREASSLPSAVAAGVAICGTIDIPVCNALLESPIGSFYSKYFLKKLERMLIAKKQQFPERIDIEKLHQIKTFSDFDNTFTAPLMGFRNAMDYWTTASACRWLDQLSVPALLIQPLNDPFLGGDCYPREVARKSDLLFLETPQSGGHCGFMTPKGQEWWPAARAKQFIQAVVDPPLAKI